MKGLLFVLTLLFTLTSYGQAYLKTKATGIAKFENVNEMEWSNVKGQVALYKDSVTFCTPENSCMVFKVYGRTKTEEAKFKGKKYTVYWNHGTNSQGEAVIVKKYIAKNHDKYYDLLWIHSEQKADIAIECSTLMKKKKR